MCKLRTNVRVATTLGREDMFPLFKIWLLASASQLLKQNELPRENKGMVVEIQQLAKGMAGTLRGYETSEVFPAFPQPRRGAEFSAPTAQYLGNAGSPQLMMGRES